MSTTVVGPAGVHRAAEAVEVLAWQPLIRLLAGADLAGGVVVLSGEDLEQHELLASHPGGATALAWHPRRATLASGGVDAVVRVHQLGGEVATVPVDGAVRALAWSPRGDQLAIGAGAGVWFVDDTGAFVGAAPLLAGAVHDVAWVADGPAPLAVAGRGGVAWLGPGLGPEPVAIWEATGATRVLAAAPGGRCLASGDLGGNVRIVDCSGGDELTLSGWSERVEHLAWDSTGRWLAVPDGDTAVLWHLDGWRLVDDEPRTLAGPETEISALAFVGACLVAGDLGGTLAFWPPDDPHSGAVGDVGAPVTCLVSAGAAMAVGAQDGTIRLVDVPLP